MFLDALYRVVTQWQFHRRWFGKDKPDRLRLGYTPDGLYPHERSAADKERIGLKTPHEPKPCTYDGKCNCAAMLRNRRK